MTAASSVRCVESVQDLGRSGNPDGFQTGGHKAFGLRAGCDARSLCADLKLARLLATLPPEWGTFFLFLLGKRTRVPDS